ncbi:MAG: glycosyltransferase family 9 protein [Proteobacteria bacterium]|nr:glycosyltransferase family 9 protein [Pseudomonadota bacterium]MBU1738358.1 glycosyltransferase family 9 protein [Pseudomonadota bacterium]
MTRKKHKVLIIKLGYSETLIPEIGNSCSLGDVMRSTVVLHLFKDDHVTWLTDAAAVPLLEGNSYIDRILVFDLLTVLQLEEERFDKVINLEKVPGICAMVNRISAWSHSGFRFDPETGRAEAYEMAHEALAVATREDFKKLNDKNWAEVLFDMLGATWNGESFILGYQPKSTPVFDVGFNTNVGPLLPVKAWPEEYWHELEMKLTGDFSVSYQQHLNNLIGYIEWINSCKMLVTSDSLGLYLGIALGKKVLALFGPTSEIDQSPHPNLRFVKPELARDCIPCLKKHCDYDDPCMRYISTDQVLAVIHEWLPGE